MHWHSFAAKKKISRKTFSFKYCQNTCSSTQCTQKLKKKKNCKSRIEKHMKKGNDSIWGKLWSRSLLSNTISQIVFLSQTSCTEQELNAQLQSVRATKPGPCKVHGTVIRSLGCRDCKCVLTEPQSLSSTAKLGRKCCIRGNPQSLRNHGVMKDLISTVPSTGNNY